VRDIGNAVKRVFQVHRITSQSRRMIKVIAGLPTEMSVAFPND
jgi:hypothetical protein